MLDLLMTALSICSRNNIKIIDDRIINLIVIFLLFRLLNIKTTKVSDRGLQVEGGSAQMETSKKIHEECKHESSSLADLIRNKFRGSRITVVFQSGGSITGEVLYGSENILVLKAGNETNYINPASIVSIS